MGQGRISKSRLKMPMQYFVSASAFLAVAIAPWQSAYSQTSEETETTASSQNPSDEKEILEFTSPRTINLRNAADNLSSILGQAKENGLLRAKGGDDNISEDQNGAPITKIASGPSRCDMASILDLNKLIGVETYEDLLLYKNEIVDVSTREGMVEFSRLTLALGLGAEAKALLANFSGDDIKLASRLAHILDDPDFSTDDPIFANYSDCHGAMPILSLVEKSTEELPSFTGVERRELLSGFDNFPKVLKEAIAVKLATKALENGDEQIGKAIWRKLDNDARENGTLLPIEKLERDEYLYLNALLKKGDDPDYYRAVLNYLAERESVYQLKALKLLSESNRRAGESNKLIADTLEGIREILPKSSEKTDASYELVKNRIYAGQVLEAIDTTKKYFTVSDKEYLESATQLRAIVEALLTDDDSRQRFAGLNNYLYDTLFFEASGDTDVLKYEALSVAIAFGLPQLYEDIVGSDKAALSSDVKSLIKQAQFLIALKANNFKLPDNFTSLDLSDLTQLDIARQALADKNYDTADTIITSLKQSSEKSDIERALALTKGQWADLFEKSQAQARTQAQTQAESQAQNQSKRDDGKSEAPLSTILSVLDKGNPKRAVTNGKGWVDKMPQYLSDMDETLQKTKAYLKNG